MWVRTRTGGVPRRRAAIDKGEGEGKGGAENWLHRRAARSTGLLLSRWTKVNEGRRGKRAIYSALVATTTRDDRSTRMARVYPLSLPFSFIIRTLPNGCIRNVT